MRRAHRSARKWHKKAKYEDVQHLDAFNSYRWVGSCLEYCKEEVDLGIFDGTVQKLLQAEKSKRCLEPRQVGLLRHLYVLLDCTESMAANDLKPSRFQCSLKLLQVFLGEYYENNPLSRLGIIALRKADAVKLTELTGTKSTNSNALESMQAYALCGQPSLYNGLSIALEQLKTVPSHALREILVITSALTTVDPGPLDDMIDLLKAQQIRCSVIALSAEVALHHKLVQKTKGIYGAVMDDVHFFHLLWALVDPPMESPSKENTIVKVGFPCGGDDPWLSFCDSQNGDGVRSPCLTGAYCPQCSAKYAELPTECEVCGLVFATARSVSGSFDHLFPVAPFAKLPYNGQSAYCHACEHIFSPTTDSHVYRCPDCAQIFCADCEILMHVEAHLCVGCAAQPATSAEKTGEVNAIQNF